MPMVERHTITGLLVLHDYQKNQIIEIEEKFNSYVNDFKSLKHSKKEEKYIREIYDYVRKNFLKMYVPSTTFADLVTIKRYDQITATAVFALFLQALDIRYYIVKSSISTYILVGTSTNSILIEPMDPINGFGSVSEEFKESFLNQLVNSGIIDPTQKLVSGSQVFNVHYYTKEYIDINELVGLEYLEYGLTEFNQGDYLQAVNTLKKSYLLHTSLQSLEVIIAVSASHLIESKYTQEADIDILAFLAALDLPAARKAGIEGEFGRLLFESLTNRYDTAYAKLARDKICSSAGDLEMREEMDYLYNYEQGRLLYNKGQYAEALPFTSRAYDMRPKNGEAEQLIVANVQNLLHVNQKDTQKSLNVIEQIFAQHPEMEENRNLCGYRLFLYLKDMAESFENKNESKALASKARFEALMVKSAYGVSEYDIGTAYSKGITYYFKRGRYSNAKAMANDGLKLAPDNPELQMRKRMINASMN